MKQLTRMEAAALARKGTVFNANGKPLSAQELMSLPRPGPSATEMMNQAIHRMTSAFDKLTPREATKPILKWTFEIVRDAAGRAQTINATAKES